MARSTPPHPPKSARRSLQASSLWLVPLALSAAACTHTVKLEAPKEPIKIDLNVNINQRVVVSLDKEVQELIKNNPNIF